MVGQRSEWAHTVVVVAEANDLPKALDEQSGDGWEVVSVVYQPTSYRTGTVFFDTPIHGQFVAVLRRPAS